MDPDRDRKTDPRKPLISYIRVSTDKQGRSGLGLDAQVADVEGYRRSVAGVVLAEYREIETSKRATLDNRPELRRALDHCRLARACLVIAKLDRLARNVHVLSGLMESGIDFVACDIPHAYRLTIHILAAVAEDEARRISQRTRDALRAYKARGGVLGSHDPRCPKLSRELSLRGAHAGGDASRIAARQENAAVLPILRQLRATCHSYEEMARRLNELGYQSRRGCSWSRAQVRRVLLRSDAVEYPGPGRGSVRDGGGAPPD